MERLARVRREQVRQRRAERARLGAHNHAPSSAEASLTLGAGASEVELAVDLTEQGRVWSVSPGMRELFREALTARREVLGARHPSTLDSFNILAQLLEKKGELGKAEELYQLARAAAA